MSLHITKFIDRIRSYEARNIKDFTMSIQEAKDLHTDITKLLLKLEEKSIDKPIVDSTIELEIRGPKF